MQPKSVDIDQLVSQVYRREFGRLTALLCRHFGLPQLETAQDLVSEAFLKAAEQWSVKGVPDDPAAWLYTVASNKMRDHLKRLSVFEARVRPAVTRPDLPLVPAFELNQQEIADAGLAMMFAVCNADGSVPARISLALQVLCGFSVDELAGAFLENPETTRKRLQRAKRRLRDTGFRLEVLSAAEIRAGLPMVLKTLYLLFNEGYFSGTGKTLIKRELCAEAIRLGLLLIENPATNSAEANALLALMCYQASRLDARIDPDGQAILYDDQDRQLWDARLIERGNYFLVEACTGNRISVYHLEASIAYWHSSTAGEEKWAHILELYNHLILEEYAPVRALNRVYVYARVHGYKAGIEEAEKLELSENHQYHGLLAELYSESDLQKALLHCAEAIKLCKSVIAGSMLKTRLESLRTRVSANSGS